MNESRRVARKVRGWFLPFLFIFAGLAYLSFVISLPLIKPLAWSVLLSFIVYPLFKHMKDRLFPGRSLNIPAGIATCVIIVVIFLPGVFGVYMAARQGLRLYGRIADVVSGMDMTEGFDVSAFLPDVIMDRIRPWMEQYPAFRDMVQQAGAWTASTAVRFSRAIVTETFSMGYYLVIIFIACFFMIRDGHLILDYLMDITPLPPRERRAFFDRARQILQAVVYGAILTASIQGILGGLGWWYVGLPSPMFFGTLMAFLAMIPFVGTVPVWGGGAAYLISSGNISCGAILFFWGLFVVSTVDNFIRPYFISEGGNVHLLIVFVGAIGGLAAWGFLGLFMGPLVISLFVFILESYRTMWAAYLRPERSLEPPSSFEERK